MIHNGFGGRPFSFRRSIFWEKSRWCEVRQSTVSLEILDPSFCPITLRHLHRPPQSTELYTVCVPLGSTRRLRSPQEQLQCDSETSRVKLRQSPEDCQCHWTETSRETEEKLIANGVALPVPRGWCCLYCGDFHSLLAVMGWVNTSVPQLMSESGSCQSFEALWVHLWPAHRACVQRTWKHVVLICPTQQR